MKVLLTGAGGLLGLELQRQLVTAGVDLVTPTRSQLDITDRAAVHETVQAVRPDRIVNCAAATDVDWCEENEEQATLVNSTAVGYLQHAAATVGARLVTFSSDYVFDGRQTQPYVESDPVVPLGAYGRSKVAGEALLESPSTVIRSSWLCGSGSGIITTILGLLGGSGHLTFVDDQTGSPTFVADLARATVSLLNDPPSGVMHLANTGAVSWFELAQNVALAAGYDPQRIQPIATCDLMPPRAALRPAYSVLASERGAALRDYREALADLVSFVD